MLKFIGPLIVVEDMPLARRFYEQLLEQKVQFDFGENVSFEGNLALHLRPHFQRLLGETPPPVVRKAQNGELYFETDDLERFQQRLQQADVEFIHPIQEQPWAQRVMRVYDPDGHIVEIAETMPAVAQRLHGQGLPVDRICEKTGLPRDYIEDALRQ